MGPDFEDILIYLKINFYVSWNRPNTKCYKNLALHKYSNSSY